MPEARPVRTAATYAASAGRASSRSVAVGAGREPHPAAAMAATRQTAKHGPSAAARDRSAQASTLRIMRSSVVVAWSRGKTSQAAVDCASPRFRPAVVRCRIIP